MTYYLTSVKIKYYACEAYYIRLKDYLWKKGSEEGSDEIKFLVHPIYFEKFQRLQIFS